MSWFNRSKKKLFKTISDEELCVIIKSNSSKDVIAEFYQRYGHLVLGVCMKYLKNKMDAEDMTIDIYSKLQQKILKSDIKYFKSWLYTLVKNECLMKLRKKQMIFSSLNSNEIESEDIDFDSKMNTEKQYEYLSFALEQLSQEQRTCVELFYLKSMSYKEISQKTGFEIKNVKSHIQNGKRNLKLSINKMT